MINRSVCTFKTKLFDIERIYPVMSKKNNSKQSKEQDKPSKESSNPAIGLDKSNNILIQVLAKPGAKQNVITGISDQGVGIQINAPPTDGEANTELVKYVASVLGLRKSDVALDKGFKSRSKCLKISSDVITFAEVKKKIEEEIES